MDLSKCSETYYVLRGKPPFDFKLLHSIPLLQGVPKSQLTLNPLAGWSNRNWHLDFQEKSYVLRLAGVGSEQHIDRAAEAENIRIVARVGLTKDALFHDATTGLQLRAFVEGQVLYEQLGMLPEQRIVKIGEILRKLHDSPFPFRNTVNHFAVLKTYQALIQRQRHALSKAYESLFRLMSDIEQRLMPIPFAARPCHNDPNLANFIATSDKTLLLMDWEYSGNGDPAWDLAYVSNYGSFSSEEEALLIQAYGLKHDPSFLSRMTVYKPVSEFMFALWIRLQIANAHFPVQREELIEAERLSLQNAEENLSEPSFQNAFQALNLRKMLNNYSS